MPNYQNGKVYTIRSRSRPDLIYVGSTTQKLSDRFSGHKRERCSSRQIVDIGDSYIELHENYPCANKEELNRREGEVIRSMECVNARIEGRTKQEWYQDNREEILAYHKQYDEDHKKEKSAYDKQYREDNKKELSAKGKQYREDNKKELSAKKKQYYQDNKEEISAKGKQYYQDNKKERSAKHKQYNQSKKDMQTCICGTEYNCGNTYTKNRHYRTTKHQAHVKLYSKQISLI